MKFLKSLILLFLVIFITSCSQGKFWFQRNDPEPPYRLFDLLDDYPALYDAFSGIDQHTFNVLMADSINADVDAVKDVLPVVASQDVVDPLVDTIGALRSILGRIVHQDEMSWPNDSYTSYSTDFYGFLDDLSATSPGTTDEILNILRKVIGYIQYAHGSELEVVMADLIEFLQDSDGQSLKTVFPQLQEGLGKLLVRANTFYGDNNRLGNAAEGMDALLSGINDIATGDPEAREALYDVIRETGNLLTASVGSKSFADVLKELLINAEDYATVGGSVYSSNTSYNKDGTDYYVNTELRNGIKQLWPGLVMLFIRAAENPDACPIYDPVDENSPYPDGRSALEYLTQKLYDLKLNCGIDFTNYEIEPSLKRMVEYNAYGDSRSSASYKVSYLDHLLFTLIASYDFGFLTRKANSSNEPYANDSNDDPNNQKCRLHGIPTGGIMTVNDSLYSMTGGAILASSSQGDIGYFGSYNLALDLRVNDFTWPSKSVGLATVTVYNKGQGNYVYRSSTPFPSTQAADNKFYLGYDFPTLALLSGACAGDAGIPNGGKTGIIPNNNNTTVGDSNNDYRTYYPYVGNGLGELNTGRWVMGWIARSCWEGEGPYYYADPNAPTKEIDGKTYCVYFRPDGRIYAFVDKSNPSDWKYFYPVDGGNDVEETDTVYAPLTLGSYKLRQNRYKAKWHTDYYLMKADYVCYDDDANHGGVKYYSPANVVGTTGVDKYKMYSLNGTTGQGQYGNDLDASTTNAGALWFWEKIAENNASRACASQEEAMFRNYQWLILEKKFVFIMPMRSYLGLLASACGADFNINVDALVYAIIEGNGIAGIANAKKGSQIGYWALSGSEGTALGHPQPISGANYGDSHTLADGRVWVLVKEDASWDKETVIIVPMTEGDYVDINKVWDSVLKGGNVLPNAVGENIAPIARMAFLQSSLVASNSTDIGNESSSTWQNRNKLLPIVVALAGDLHEKSHYEPPTSGYWYNFAEASKHRYPLKHLRDLIAMLDSPIMRYYKTPYTGASKGWYVPQIQDPHGRGTYAFFTPKPIDSSVNFAPNASLRSVVQVLTDSGPNSAGTADGLIPALANTKMVTRLMALLQKVGQYGDSALPIYVDEDKMSTDYTQWGARRKIFYGLEQILTRIKGSKAVELVRGYYDVGYPNWMFNPTGNDVSLDVVLDELIGSSDTDETPETGEKGLAVLVDGRSDSNPDRNWNNYYKLMNGIAELMSNQGSTTGQYCITNDLVSVIDKSLTSFQATDAQLKGVRHTLGAVMTYYDEDTGQWLVPNELNDILTGYLPQILNGFAGHYGNLMTVANNMLVDDGFVEYFMTNLSSSYPSQQVFEELYAFLGTDLIANPDSRLWDDLGELLIAFASMMNDVEKTKYYKTASFEDLTKSVYTSPAEYLYSQEFDPYSGLGQVLTK